MINEEIIISNNYTLQQALQLMDSLERKLLVICEEGKFVGVISIGDIQRAILAKVELSDLVTHHIRPDMIFAHEGDDDNKIADQMIRERIECMPVVDDDNNLIRLIEWDEITGRGSDLLIHKVDYPVVIMAGGKGTRLKPLTNMLPKPLVPISEKTIIEEIMDFFVEAGCSNFYISLNYRGDLIKDFFGKLNNQKYKISYIEEDQPLGTAGSLAYLKNVISQTFIVSNCDILMEVNLYDLIQYHKSNDNIATAVSVMKNISIPYGTIDTKENGILTGLKEKPNIMYQINSGMYVLEPEILSYIKHKEHIDITDLFQRIQDDNKQIGVFPIPEGAWSDMGSWDEYLKVIAKKNNNDK